MRYPAAEKLKIIRLVEQSHLPVRRTLAKIGIPPTTFYRWYDRVIEHGPEGLEDRPSSPSRVWNRIPEAVRDQIVTLALEEPDLSPRELAFRFTDTEKYPRHGLSDQWRSHGSMIDLFSRRVIGWSMQGRTYADLPLQALLMAVWRRKPKTTVQVHSDQGSQFTSYKWQEFLEQHNLTQSMSRRGTCWDNAVAESFFNLLKRERIRRKKYKTREEARRDVFDYIEFFYNPQRKHVRNGMLSPIAFEQQQKLKLQGV